MEINGVGFWSEEELQAWAKRHSDAWHPGDRDDCEHCRAMIETFGPMPPIYLIVACAPTIKDNRKEKAHIPEATRWEVWERDDFTWRHCGSRRELSVDHIIPESKGGPSDISNYQTLCRRCNSAKWNRGEV